MKRNLKSTFYLNLVLVMTIASHSWGEDMPENKVVAKTQTASTQKKSSNLTADWRLRLSGNDTHDEQSQSKYVSMRLDLRSKYLLTSSLQLDLQPSLRLISGQSQTIDGADHMENKILLNQAAAHYTPVEFFTLSGGALMQRTLHTILLMDEIAFPAARATAKLKNSSIESSLSIETAIPTSTSLSTNTKEMEPTPSLNTASVQFNWGSKEMFLKTRAGYFIFNNLPSAVAQQSLLLGNTVQNISDAQYKFLRQYQGPEAAIKAQLPVVNYLDLLAEISYVHNDKAPSEDATATYYVAGYTLHFKRDIDWTLKGGPFSVAPDAVVAYFNANHFESNRVGYAIESDVSFKKQNFMLGLVYKESEVMYQNPAQSHDQFLMLKLETFYADI